MRSFIAFVQGMREFRSDVTIHYDDYDLSEAYDRGRDLMHAITFRKYEV